MKKQNLLLIIGTLGIAGLIFLLQKRTPGATAGITTPAVTPPTPTSAYPALSGCEGEIVAMAEQQLGLSRDQLTVRSLRPNDLGLNTWSFNLAATGWNTVINANVADNRFICLKSVSYSGTAAESIRVNAGSSVVAEFSIEQIPGITTTHTASIRDIIVEQNMPIRIEVYASAISATDNVILSGSVVEKKGMVLA